MDLMEEVLDQAQAFAFGVGLLVDGLSLVRRVGSQADR
jgi:hypothetical protein